MLLARDLKYHMTFLGLYLHCPALQPLQQAVQQWPCWCAGSVLQGIYWQDRWASACSQVLRHARQSKTVTIRIVYTCVKLQRNCKYKPDGLASLAHHSQLARQVGKQTVTVTVLSTLG